MFLHLALYNQLWRHSLQRANLVCQLSKAHWSIPFHKCSCFDSLTWLWLFWVHYRLYSFLLRWNKTRLTFLSFLFQSILFLKPFVLLLLNLELKACFGLGGWNCNICLLNMNHCGIDCIIIFFKYHFQIHSFNNCLLIYFFPLIIILIHNSLLIY